MNTREEEEQVDQFLIHDLFYWIGLSDLATEGSYVWAESHAEAEYTNWAADQPGGDTSQQEQTCNRCLGIFEDVAQCYTKIVKQDQSSRVCKSLI